MLCPPAPASAATSRSRRCRSTSRTTPRCARFEREAKTVSSLNHPNICTRFDVGREGDTDYLVMELVEGETLAARLLKGALPLADVLKLGAQIAEALERAHRAGVIHRDLKPGNVMLTKSGGKLMDSGLARATGAGPASGSGVAMATVTHSPTMAAPLTAEGTILGTFQYMAPEQLEGARPTRAATCGRWISGMMAGTSALPAWGEMTLEALRGTTSSFVAIMTIHTVALLNLWMPVTMLLILRLLLRRTSLAVAAVTLLSMVLSYPASGDITTYLIGSSVQAAIFWVVLLRFGLLPLAVVFSVSSLMGLMPLSMHPSDWYLGGMLLALGFIAAPALWGFWSSQAGRPLFRDEVLEPAAGK